MIVRRLDYFPPEGGGVAGVPLAGAPVAGALGAGTGPAGAWPVGCPDVGAPGCWPAVPVRCVARRRASSWIRLVRDVAFRDAASPSVSEVTKKTTARIVDARLKNDAAPRPPNSV